MWIRLLLITDSNTHIMCMWEKIVAFLLNLNSSAVRWNHYNGHSVSFSFNLFPFCITLQWSSYTRNKNPQKYFTSEGKILHISTSYIGFCCLALLFRIKFGFYQLNFLFSKRKVGAQVAHSGPIQNARRMDTSWMNLPYTKFRDWYNLY